MLPRDSLACLGEGVEVLDLGRACPDLGTQE